MVWKRSIYTVITPLPSTVSRDTAIEALHSHAQMIELNPLVVRHNPCKPPSSAPADEFHCIWYQLTDRINYLPGIKGSVNYKACFHDLPRGLQTHVYAPAGLEIKDKWTIGGNEPGEEREVIELGMSNLGVPREGLYLREDIDMRCSIFLTNFVKRTLNKAHQVLVDRLVVKTDLEEDKRVRENYMRASIMTSGDGAGFASPRMSGMYDSGLSSGAFSVKSMSEPPTPTSIAPRSFAAEIMGDLGTVSELPTDPPTTPGEKKDENWTGFLPEPNPVELPC